LSDRRRAKRGKQGTDTGRMGRIHMGEGAPLTVERGIVIDDVAIVSTRDGSSAPGRAIFVESGSIREIRGAGSFLCLGEAQRIDGSGKYAVPGYLDMHAHAMASGALSTDDLLQNFQLMIANGITGFREMAASKELISRGNLLRSETEAGKRVAPELLIIPGDILNIFPGEELGFFSESGEAAASPAERARREVLKQKEYGAEFIKIINVNRDAFFAVQETAGQVGLHVAGHLNPVVTSMEASNAGLRAMEHLGGSLSLVVDCSTAEEMIRQRMTSPPPAPLIPGKPTPEMIRRIVANPRMLTWSQPGLAMGLQFAIKTYSEEKARALAKVFVRNGTWQVPTLIRIRTMQIPDDPTYVDDPNLKYLAQETRAMWAELTETYKQRVPGDAKAAYRDVYDLQAKLVKLLKEEGVKMLAGSDMTGIYCIPGFSLLQEFQELSRAGLSPLEILQMATLNGAKFLGREGTMGTVEEGKRADLVLLDANPMESAENLGKIHAVVLRGQYLSKSDLEKMKSDVAGFYAEGRG
jgi:hypothetical protein